MSSTFHPVHGVVSWDAQGIPHNILGWLHYNDGLNEYFEPVVGNPDGPGAGRWSLYYGDDPWTTKPPPRPKKVSCRCPKGHPEGGIVTRGL